MLAHNDTAVTTTFPHPRWCTADHANAGPNLHQSPEIRLGQVADLPVSAQRIHIDPEPGNLDAQDEVWVSFGLHSTEIPLHEAADMAQQLRAIAAGLDLILGGA